MMKYILVSFLLIAGNLSAQTDVEPKRIKESIKKEKGKYGIWNKTEKKWEVPAEYLKITGVAFSDKEYEVGNRTFFKLWKENTFDLLRVTEKNYKNVYDIWLKDITAFQLPDKKFEYTSNDWYNFIFYKQNEKWGWFVKRVQVLRRNNFQIEENFKYVAKFDSPPVVTSYGNGYFYSISENNHILQVSAANLTGLYSLAGFELIPPGPYTGFVVPEHLDFSKEIFIITEGGNQLKGYSLNGAIVPPAYTTIKKTKSDVLANYEYYDCTLPGGEHEFRIGTGIISKESIETLENAERKRLADAAIAYKQKREAEEKLAREQQEVRDKLEIQTILTESKEMSPFDVVKLVRKGTVKDMLAYCKKFGQEFSTALDSGNTRYNAKGPFTSGVKYFIDAKQEGFVVSYDFKDSDQKRSNQDLLKSEGFSAKEVNAATGLLTSNGVDIWFIMGTNSWQISKAP
jgi:hypothetical protein